MDRGQKNGDGIETLPTIFRIGDVQRRLAPAGFSHAAQAFLRESAAGLNRAVAEVR